MTAKRERYVFCASSAAFSPNLYPPRICDVTTLIKFANCYAETLLIRRHHNRYLSENRNDPYRFDRHWMIYYFERLSPTRQKQLRHRSREDEQLLILTMVYQFIISLRIFVYTRTVSSKLRYKPISIVPLREPMHLRIALLSCKPWHSGMDMEISNDSQHSDIRFLV